MSRVVLPTRRTWSGSLPSAVGGLYLRLRGWRVEGDLPPIPKAVIIAAPHTSNWDLVFMLAVSWVLGARPSWLGKRELFAGPLGWLMRRLGGLPIDRSVRANAVEQVVRRFAESERLFLAVPPSGTRSRASHWRSGFYYMARGADVPIVCAYLDYRRKVGGIGPMIRPSGDVVSDMNVVREFYAGVTAKYPELTTPVRLLGEDAPTAVGI
jgi:1-acyl-sn-glycerol-3-phosphate acyltransferase